MVFSLLFWTIVFFLHLRCLNDHKLQFNDCLQQTARCLQHDQNIFFVSLSQGNSNHFGISFNRLFSHSDRLGYNELSVRQNKTQNFVHHQFIITTIFITKFDCMFKVDNLTSLGIYIAHYVPCNSLISLPHLPFNLLATF